MITIFYHIAKINNWEKIVSEHESLVSEIPDCKLIKNFLEKDNLDQYEVPTLHQLWKYAKTKDQNEIIGYIHTKGVTRPFNRSNRLWRETLNYWTLTRWKDHIHCLKDADTSGVRYINYHRDGLYLPHYSGNFWFANSNYIKTLEDPTNYAENYHPKIPSKKHSSNRYGCEMWIGSGNGEMANIDNSQTLKFTEGKIKNERGLRSYKYWVKKYGKPN